MKQVYMIHNLDCAHCAARMEERIRQLPDVRSASITFATRQLRLEAPDPDALLPQIQKIIRSIEPDAALQPKPRRDWQVLALGAVLFLVGLLSKFTPLFLVAWAVLGFDILKKALLNLFRGRLLDENFLMAIATVGAICIGQYAEAVGVVLFYRVGVWFEHRAVDRSRQRIMSAMDLRPQTVCLADGRTIPAAQAKVGDTILVRPGERIGLDGTVLSGESRVDTSAITGESVPLRVATGNAVTSGWVNTEGLLTIRVEKPLSDSMVTRILEAVEEAAANKPKMDRFISRFSKIYTPIVVLLALFTAVVPSLITGNARYWVYTALSFLVMSCPCALVLSIPLTFFSGIGAAGRKGILFKSGVAVESLSQIKGVVLDKTGTLTKGEFAVQQVVGGDGLLTLCAACEQLSTHPVAKSIVAAAGDGPLPTPDTLEELSGHGIRAILNGEEILCGNEKLMAKYDVDLSVHHPVAHGTTVIVAKNRRYLGYILISDSPKADAPDGIGQLHAMGLHTAMLTGDNAQAAEAVAKDLGIEQVYAQLLPREKLERLEELRRRHGAVLFVGDGINDAPVLSGADVGGAMGSGTDAAMEAADVVFLTNQVRAIPEAIRLSRRTRRIALQNLVFALSVKVLVMGLGLAGYASMWAAVFADSGVAVLCVLNAIRMLYSGRDSLPLQQIHHHQSTGG